jgi:hypothetical protein
MVHDVKLKLFSCAGLVAGEPVSPPELMTPLGTIALRARIDGLDSEAAAPTRVWRRDLIRGFAWKTPRLDLELLVFPYMPRIPVHMAVSAAWAVVWRFRGTERIDAPTFSCRWQAEPTWTDWDAASGELLDALEWWDTTTRLAIGTGDDDYIDAHSGRVPWLPKRWADSFGLWREAPTESLGFDFDPDEICLALPTLLPDELCQAHFLIAWRQDDLQPVRASRADCGESAVDAWFAVEQNPETFLQVLGE